MNISKPIIFTDYSGAAISGASSLVELLRGRALHQPDRLAYTFLVDGETEGAKLTYGELDQQTRTIAAMLQSMIAPGERVLLLYPSGLDYIAAFFGCLYAGAIAVPAYPPRLNKGLDRLKSVLADSQPAVALTTTALLPKLENLSKEFPGLEGMRWLATDGIQYDLGEQWQPPSIGGDTLAFLQYTSGSTSTPKGVMVSHGNLLHNERLIQQAFGQSEQSTIVGWLPLYHDMGLIGNVLQPLYAGAGCVLMSPTAFLQRPFRWLQAISFYRGTTSGGPNFAYELCARKITEEQKATLDLSSWEVAFNGAEPIREDSMDRFAAAFKVCGFRKKAFYPCYGLAEATLMVSAKPAGDLPLIKSIHSAGLEKNQVIETPAGDDDGQLLAGSGASSAEQRVIIVHPESLMELPLDQVGEIWVSGPSVTRGYWNLQQETERTFKACLADTKEGPFLRTGDLGFLRDGELFVTGRLKDLIIIRGRNHYPQDIERTVEECHPALRAGCGAAFPIEASGEEGLVVVQELDYRQQPNLDAIIESIRQSVAEDHETQVYAVALTRPGSIPKTSSGKIRRQACRRAFLDGSLDALREWKADTRFEGEPAITLPATPPDTAESMELWLASQVASKLGVDPATIDVNQPISRYGLDSLCAIELMHGIEVSVGVALPMTHFLQSTSIAQLAGEVLVQQAAADINSRITLASTDDSSNESPLSYGQRALWFLQALAPESTAYNIAAALRVHADLDVAALQRAFQALVDRHACLRTTFAELQGEPVQHINEHAEVCFRHEDASSWSEALLNTRLLEESRHSIDLNQGPLMRVSLFTISPRQHILLLVVHHIVADFWSLVILVHELQKLYHAGETSSEIILLPLTSQYTDYVRRQSEMLESAEGERLWAYWRKQLAGNLPALDLPADRPRAPMQTYRGASHTFKLTPQLTQRLKLLASANSATLYVTLLASFQAFLHRYTGQEDILVGSPVAGRREAELRGLVGYFANPLVLRADLSGDPTVEKFLDQVRQTVLSAFEHQDYPFPLLVERLQPERDPSRSPLFQVMFILQKAHLLNEEGLASFALGEAGAQMELGDLLLESVPLEQRVAQFDLTLTMAEVSEGLSASFEYNTDLFDAETILRMAECFRVLLEALVANPSQRLSSLPLLSQAEELRLLDLLNETVMDYPREKGIHELVQMQAERTPDAIAVVFESEELTYRELNRRANQLARRLRALGVGPEALVGICVERSIEMVVGLLGILKAGGAYVPLDPALPKERLAYMAADARLEVLLTQQHLVKSLSGQKATLVVLDTDWGIISQSRDETPASGVTASNLAYVIYTSGSTGKPKGVQITHRAVTNFLTSMREQPGLGPEDVLLAVTTLSFDIAGLELYLPLTTGARVVIATRETASDGEMLIEKLNASGATIMQATPATWRLLLQAGWAGNKRLKVLCGGEALARDLANELLERCDSLWNLFGPTETTIWSTAHRAGYDEGPVSIGRPIANTQVYLLDSHLHVVPVGVVGELYIGGDGLARGYLNRPELTAEKFIASPFSDDPQARIYRTGDLARYLPDGNIEFLGRVDHQVKIRGYRIELGEIEAALQQHPLIREAVVVTNSGARGNILAAYLIVEGEEAFSVRALRAYLSEKLPDYMLPSACVVLDALPLTPNGKVDRKALPAAELERPELETDYASPRTPIEDVLVLIWTDVLDIEQVGIHDNFFELGGHSLLAMQVISRVRGAFQVAIQLHKLFESPTVSGLAEEIEAALRASQNLEIPPLVIAPRQEGLPLSFAQERLWFLDQMEDDRAAYNMAGAVRLSGEVDVAALEQSLNEIIRRHEVLRTTFRVVKGKPVQIIASAQALKTRVIDLRAMPASGREDEAQRLATEEARRPFDLARGPLLRAGLIQLAEQDYVLLVTLHHIVSDGWSMGVLIREMSVLYESFSKGEPSDLDDLSIQYADFAHWQRQWLEGEALDAELSFWKQQLVGGPSVLQLPTDRPRPPVQTFRGARESLVISKSLTDSLTALSHRENATLFMTVLSVFKALLFRYTGQQDVVVGTPVANRNRVELEGLIGLFVNTLVLRTSLAGDPSFRELLARVRENSLKAFVHQDAPFEKLVESLQPVRSLSHTPLFQVMFILLNTPAQTLELAGLKLTRCDVDSKTTKFDLSLSLEESREGLIGSLEYSTDLFDRSTINRMLGHFKTMLEAAVENPATRISELQMMTPAESDQLLVEWNDTRTIHSGQACVHELIEAQARRTPDAIAVIFDGQELTYRELNERADQLASYLRRLGVGPEVRAGVCLQRSLEMVTALLGILKAGGAYVPLDPAYPRERLAFMLEDSQAPVLLTTGDLAQRFNQSRLKTVCLESDWDIISRESIENATARVSADNLAYVIYTSGSTGKPKGVAIEHHSTAALLEWSRTFLSSEHLRGVLASTSICFDLSVFELFVPLSCGGTVIVVENALDLPALRADTDVTLINTVPSAMAELIRMKALPASVRIVNLAGEPLKNALVQQIYEHETVERVFNLYGPSEDTTYSTFALAEKDTIENPTIGRPIANTQVYLLDSHMQPVPVGIAGELYIGGAGLARGYVNRPEQTAERFIPDPLSGERGARLYKTGDLARYLPGGNIEFLGRMDHQVKLRGFRIELGEIESALYKHPAVRDSVVIVREDTPGNMRLVAYLTVDGKHESAVIELRGFLREKLPDYMVPSTFVILDALPLTPNGKVDRRLLPMPEADQRSIDQPLVQPRTETERALAEICAEVLGLDRVGIHDNFFELGGHSLLATQVVSRVREVLQVEIPVRRLFESSTVASMAAFVEQLEIEQADSAMLAGLVEELKHMSEDETQLMLAAEAGVERGIVDQGA